MDGYVRVIAAIFHGNPVIVSFYRPLRLGGKPAKLAYGLHLKRGQASYGWVVVPLSVAASGFFSTSC